MDCTKIFHFTNQNARRFGNLRCQNWFSIWFSEVNINLLNKNCLGLVQSLFPIGNSATNFYPARKGIFNFCGMMGNKHICSPSPDVLKVGTNRVDLLQVDLTSSLQAKGAFVAAKRPSERRSRERSSSRAILNRTKDFYESLPIGPSSLHFISVAKRSYKPTLDTLYSQINEKTEREAARLSVGLAIRRSRVPAVLRMFVWSIGGVWGRFVSSAIFNILIIQKHLSIAFIIHMAISVLQG